MDKKIMYGIGGVAVIGIIAYLYNKKKKDDALKMATTATPPPSMETIIDMGGMTPTLLEDSMVVMPDGSIVDGSLIAVETNPTSMVEVDPTRVPVDMMATTSPISLIDSKNVTTMSSTSPAKFDGGFANAIGVKPTSSFNPVGYVPQKCGSGRSCPQGTFCLTNSTNVATGETADWCVYWREYERSLYQKFDGGFDYADGYGCSLDPVLGM